MTISRAWTFKPSSAETALKIDQDNNAVSLDIDSEATTVTVMSCETQNTDGNVFLFRNNGVHADSGNYVLNVVQEHSSSVGGLSLFRNDGSGAAILVDQNGDAKSLNIDSEATTATCIQYDANINNDVYSIMGNHNGSIAWGIRKNTDVNTNCCLRLGNYWLWVDSTGDLRIDSTYPGSDTAGTVVGTQT